jgi:hypothetical protein
MGCTEWFEPGKNLGRSSSYGLILLVGVSADGLARQQHFRAGHASSQMLQHLRYSCVPCTAPALPFARLLAAKDTYSIQ